MTAAWKETMCERLAEKKTEKNPVRTHTTAESTKHVFMTARA